MTSKNTLDETSLVYRLRRRAEIRRSIPRASEQSKDRISNILEEAANEIERLQENDNRDNSVSQ